MWNARQRSGIRRPPATAKSYRRRSPLQIVRLVLFPPVLAIPLIAVYCLARDTDWRIVTGYLAIISGTTYFLYGRDKKAAQEGTWRTPESALHLAEFAGGWPAAFVAQRKFRHKTAKTSYQILFWLIAVVHQYLAVDYMIGWQIAKAIPAWTETLSFPR